MVKSYVILLLLFWTICSAKAQYLFSPNKYPLVDFRPPLDIRPPALSGSFGEIRGNHFHSGMDYRTNQREGYPVFAIADGYVSRIKVENSGFGLALYLNHPNGYTSVYGHMQRFNPKISQHVLQLQYEKKSFQLDDQLLPALIPVHKGDIIGYSGNRGSSGGPHLHFEIRDTKTEATINPQLFGLEIPDNIAPVIHAMYVYRLNNKPFNEFTPKQYYPVVGTGGKYRLNKVNTLRIGGEFGLGITVTDKHNGASGTNGVYSIQLEVDGNLVFTSAMEQFKFENSKGVNSHIDYPGYMTTRRSIQKSFVDPGNPLQIYYDLVNRGRIDFTDQAIHDLKYTITDSKGNESTLQFKVQADSNAVIMGKKAPAGIFFPYDQQNDFNNNEVKVSIPKGSLYNDMNFVYATSPQPANNAYSTIHEIHNKLTPLHAGFDLWIKADSTVIPHLDKALIVNTNRVSQGGVYENGYIKARPRNFGSFFISLDTLAPTIVPLNISQDKRMSGISKMTLRIRDNLSGLKSFNGYIDGKWVLMEFDAKTATLWHTFDHRTGAGKHTLTVVAIDMKNNSKTINIDFYR